MKGVDSRLVSRRFRSQYGVMSRRELRALGVTAKAEARRVSAGEWERPTPRVVRLAGSTPGPEQALMTALLEAGPGAVASHQSAVWLWDLSAPPERHSVTVGVGTGWRPGPFDIHRLQGRPPMVSFQRGIPTTNPLRALVDLAGVATATALDDAVDRAISRRLVTVEGLREELARVGGRGRKGAGVLNAALRRRGLLEGPQPSVLEARWHRLLRAGGIVPMGAEVVAGPDGAYRIDTLLVPGVAAEVDGHTYHYTPEQKAYDERRRAELRLEGLFLLVYGWRDITHDGRRVLAECHQAIARYGSLPTGRLSRR
jgi:hypothetical protein